MDILRYLYHSIVAVFALYPVAMLTFSPPAGWYGWLSLAFVQVWLVGMMFMVNWIRHKKGRE